MTRHYYWRGGGTAALAALAASSVAGCGGSSSPQVASLGKSTGGTSVSTTTVPKGNPTQLLDEWATCMRANGVPNLADPTITSTGSIHIVMPAGNTASPGAITGNSGSGSSPCGSYLQAASQALSGKSGAGAQRPDPAKLLKYSECMQKSGFPQFPDLSADGGLSLKIQPGSTMNPNNPAFVSASNTCAKKAGVPGLGNPNSAPAGAIQIQSGPGPSGGPGGNGGAGAVVGSGGAVSGSSGSGSGGFSSGGSGG